MAETWEYIESSGVVHALTVDGVYKYLDGEGLYNWDAEPIVDEIPHSIAVHRAYKWNWREIVLRLAVQASTYNAVQRAVRDLLAYFVPDIDANAEGTLRVVSDADIVHTIAVAPAKPEIEKVWVSGAFVKLHFVAADTFWTRLPSGRVASVFNGVTPVAVSFHNFGDTKAWPTFVITGVVSAPKITYPDGSYIQIGTATLSAADRITIYTKPGLLRVDYEAGGTASPVNWTGYAGTASTFARLPRGAGSLTLSAASGTPTFVATWDHLRIGIE